AKFVQKSSHSTKFNSVPIASLKMPRQKKSTIHVRNRPEGFTISIVGKIENTIILKNNLKQSSKQTKADYAKIILQYSNKQTNYSTTFELNHVIYDKVKKILKAENGSGETTKSSASKINAKTLEEVTKYEMGNSIFLFT
ncbi:34892_t:CDS:1, partial [Racocetra persica]